MNQRPLVLLIPAAAVGLTALIYVATRRHRRIRAEISALSHELQNERSRIDDLRDYLQPVRDYGSKPRS